MLELAAVEGDGDDGNFRRFHIWCQVRDRFGEHTTQNVGCRTNSIVLQKVDQLAKAGFVGSVGRSFGKRRTLRKAFTTKGLCQSAEEAFAAQQAATARNRRNGIEAF